MRIFKPFEKITELKNGVFLAGPTARTGKEYKESCNWREELISKLQKVGFDGDVIDPVNHNFETCDLEKQIAWEVDGMKLASLVLFWIPRTEEHPALTTNIEYGTWLDNNGVLVGFPGCSIKNEYILVRENMNDRMCFKTLDLLVEEVMKRFLKPTRYFFTSDTHFTSERTLQLSRRPFTNVKEMDLQMISNWNKTVGANDIVYHLGDFGNQDIISLLNFKKMNFVLGNYERDIDGWERLSQDKRVNFLEKGEFVDKSGVYQLVHEPIGNNFETDISFTDNLFFLFGHIHRLQTVKRNGINVGVDAHRFTPIGIEEIRFLRGGIENHFDDNVFSERCE